MGLLDFFKRKSPKKEPALQVKAEDLVEIRFERSDPDEGVETPQGAELSYLDAQALKFWDGKKTDFVIPPYYSDTAFGRNVGPALTRLLDGGYLQKADVRRNIALKTVPELKAILAERELNISGKKAELIQRILDNIPISDVESIFPVGQYEITKRGEQALEPYNILSLNQDYGLGFSYYRLLKEKEKSPESSDVDTIVRLLTEDIQNCYKNGDKTSYQRILSKAAMFMNGNGEPEKALECYCMSFFIWTREIETYAVTTGSAQSYYLAKNIEDCGKICGLTLQELLRRFSLSIKNNNPFGLGTDRNITYAVSVFKEALSIE